MNRKHLTEKQMIAYLKRVRAMLDFVRECRESYEVIGRTHDIIPLAPKKPKPAKTKCSAPRGPKPEPFKASGMTLEEATTKSFHKKKPTGGWPK